jgi:hypothetical protein
VRVLAKEAWRTLVTELEPEILEDEVADEQIVRTNARNPKLSRSACLADPISDRPQIRNRLDLRGYRVGRSSRRCLLLRLTGTTRLARRDARALLLDRHMTSVGNPSPAADCTLESANGGDREGKWARYPASIAISRGDLDPARRCGGACV